MHRFTTKYADRLVGTLSGFDRLVFRGTLRRLSFVEGLQVYLSQRKVLLKEFGAHVQAVSEHCQQRGGRPHDRARTGRDRRAGLPADQRRAVRRV
jgi:hypothetical protein